LAKATHGKAALKDPKSIGSASSSAQMESPITSLGGRANLRAITIPTIATAQLLFPRLLMSDLKPSM